jgi:hypothetical protein
MEALRIVNSAREIVDEMKACYGPVASKPEYARILEKIAFATTSDLERMPSQAQLADSERVSDSDIAAALNLYAEQMQCVAPELEKLVQIDPEFLVNFTEAQKEITEITHEAVTTHPSFGHINQRLADYKLRQKEASKRIGKKIAARLLAQRQQEQAVAEGVAELAVDALLVLGTRQVRLVRAQQAFAKANAAYQLTAIRTVQCNPNIKAALAQATASARAQIMSNYAARGMAGSSAMAADLAAANNQALVASVSTGCSF